MPVEDQKPTPPFVTWHDETSKEKAIGSMSDAVDAYDGVQRSTASHRSFLDIESNRSVRTSYQRRDYDAFRTDERIPTKQKQIIKMCMEAYDKVGIIRNVIDLMGDFASQGITLVHPNKTIEKLVGDNPFYVSYFKKDGTIREMPNAKLHEIDLAKVKNPNINKTQIIVFDEDKEGYRTVNIDKIIEISRGEEFKLVDSKYNELIEEDKMYQKIDTEKDMENYILNKILKNIKTESEVINGT